MWWRFHRHSSCRQIHMQLWPYPDPRVWRLSPRSTPRVPQPPTRVMAACIPNQVYLVNADAVGLSRHKGSTESEYKQQARKSWGNLELKSIKLQYLPVSVRQGYIACKCVMQRFLKVDWRPNETADVTCFVYSYHIKTVFRHFLEERPPPMITSPFGLFLDILHELVGITKILSALIDALLTSPAEPQQIFGDIHPNGLLVAIHSMMTSSNGNIFRVTGHLCGEFTGPRWIPHTKASDAALWCLLWSAPE